MNHEIKTKWLAALRSGDYRKSVHVLKRYFKHVPARYCCMGVLCDIIKEDHPHAQELIEQKVASSMFGNSKMSKFALLDQETLSYTGVEMQQQRRLTTMNDKGASFLTIAKYIEKYV